MNKPPVTRRSPTPNGDRPIIRHRRQGGGRVGAWLAAAVAVVAAGAAISAPVWAPEYLPEVWPGPPPASWTDGVTADVQAVQSQAEEASQRVAAVTDAQVETATDLSTLTLRTDALEALVADATGVSDARSLVARIQEVEDRLQALPTDLATVGAVAQAVADSENRLAALPAQAVADGLAPIDQRLVDLERLPGQIGELQAQLGAIEIDAQRLDDINGRLEALSVAMGEAEDRLNGRLEALSVAMGEAEGRLVEIARIAEARRAADVAAQALSLAVGQLRSDLAAGAPFVTSLATINSLVAAQPDLADQIDRLAPFAENGIPTRNQLIADLSGQLGLVRSAAGALETDDVFDRALNTLEGLVRIRPAPGEVAGAGIGATLARAEHRAGAGDLAGAVEALAGLDGRGAAAATSWLTLARARLAAEEVMAALDTAALERLAAEETGAAEDPVDGASAPADQG